MGSIDDGRAAGASPGSGQNGTDQPQASGPALSGVGLIAAGVAVFIVCSIVQAVAGDSSMFSMTYLDDGRFLPGLLVTVTFWPGWIVTAGLIGRGVMEL